MIGEEDKKIVPPASQQPTQPVQPTTADLLANKLSQSVGSATTQPVVQPTQPKTYSLSDIMSRINQLEQPVQPVTEEDLAAERKKRKRETVFSSIGDATSALANLYFTSQGAKNAYNPSLSLSKNVQDRYDKIKRDRDANRDKQLQYLYRRYGIAKADARYEEHQQKEQMRYDRQQERLDRADEENKRRYEEQKQQAEAAAAENKRRFNVQQATQQSQFREIMNLRKKEQNERNAYNVAKLAAAKVQNRDFGQKLAFSDGNITYPVYKNLFDASYTEIFDAMLSEGKVKMSDAQKAIYDSVGMSADDIKEFVTNNWNKSDAAKEVIRKMSETTKTLSSGNTSTTSPTSPKDDDFSEYIVNGQKGDEDFSEYEIK